MKRLIVVLAALLVVVCARAVKVDTVLVKSPSMQKDIKTVVVLPDVAAQKACPVIYLCMGMVEIMLRGSVLNRTYLR